MGLYQNGQKLGKPCFGGVKYNCFYNGQKIWTSGSPGPLPPTPPSPIPEPTDAFYIEAFYADGSPSLDYMVTPNKSNTSTGLKYSLDDMVTWKDWIAGTLTPVTNRIYFKILGNGLFANIGGNTWALTSLSTSGVITYFKVGGAIVPQGGTLDSYAFAGMFQNQQNLKYISKDLLPYAGVGSGRAYQLMFKNCTSLENGCDINLTSIGQYGCQQMFDGCINMIEMGNIKSVSMANYSCSNMFLDCVKLNPANPIEIDTAAPPAGSYAMFQMFKNCNQLKHVKVAFDVWNGMVTNNWMEGVFNDAICSITCPGALPDVRGTSNIPTLWQKIDY